jgi:Flp pilus assembly protein TadG
MTRKLRQMGGASIEFALTAVIFFMLAGGIVELGRVIYAWNAAAEATRAGARMASISSIGSPEVETSMRKVIAGLQSSQVQVEYLPDGCSANDCERVRVSIVDYWITPLVIPAAMLPVPSASTTVPRESLGIVL